MRKPRLRSFKLYNQTVRVKYKKKVLDVNGTPILGDCDTTSCLIVVSTHSPETGTPLDEEALFHSVCHEMGHYFVLLSGRPDLYKDEKFVDWFGGLLAQFLRSATWR